MKLTCSSCYGRIEQIIVLNNILFHKSNREKKCTIRKYVAFFHLISSGGGVSPISFCSEFQVDSIDIRLFLFCFVPLILSCVL